LPVCWGFPSMPYTIARIPPSTAIAPSSSGLITTSYDPLLLDEA
jgi:hypothetical protein